jgi:hypothetical protein
MRAISEKAIVTASPIIVVGICEAPLERGRQAHKRDYRSYTYPYPRSEADNTRLAVVSRGWLQLDNAKFYERAVEAAFLFR